MAGKRIRIHREKHVSLYLEGQCFEGGGAWDTHLYFFDHYASVAEAKKIASQCGNGFRYRIIYKDENGHFRKIEGRTHVTNTIKEIPSPPPYPGGQIESNRRKH